MSDPREQISAFTDGELPEHEAELLLKRLQTDKDLRGIWERFQLVGDAMRQGLAPVHDPRFADKLRDAIENEPVAPRSLRGDRVMAFFKPVAGLGIAATVATVAILGVQSQQITPPSEVVPTNSSPAETSVDYRLAQPVNWNLTEQEEVKEKLNSYLVNHNLHSKSRTFQGLNPYVHIAAYDNRVSEQDETTSDPDEEAVAEK